LDCWMVCDYLYFYFLFTWDLVNIMFKSTRIRPLAHRLNARYFLCPKRDGEAPQSSYKSPSIWFTKPFRVRGHIQYVEYLHLACLRHLDEILCSAQLFLQSLLFRQAALEQLFVLFCHPFAALRFLPPTCFVLGDATFSEKFQKCNTRVLCNKNRSYSVWVEIP